MQSKKVYTGVGEKEYPVVRSCGHKRAIGQFKEDERDSTKSWGLVRKSWEREVYIQDGETREGGMG